MRLEKIKIIREKLQNGKASIGTWQQIPHASISEILGHAGYDWVAVDIEPMHPLVNPVSLKMIKADKKLENMRLIKQSRLSVMPVTAGEFNHVLKLGGK